MSRIQSEISAVYSAFETLRHERQEDQYCIHELHNLMKRLPAKSKRKFLARLFWMLWIDQAVYSVLNPEGRRYRRFRREFPFPKVRWCPMFWQLPPGIVAQHLGVTHRRGLLTRHKKAIWEPVSSWIKKNWLQRTLDKVFGSMSADLGKRVPSYLDNLLPSVK